MPTSGVAAHESTPEGKPAAGGKRIAGRELREVYYRGGSFPTTLGVMPSMAQVEPLEREQRVYEAHLAEWRGVHLGKFVLIKDENVLGFFDSLEAAFNEGTARFGLDLFFVKQITEDGAVNVSFFGQRLESV